MVVRLTKQSTAPEIRCYFEGVLSLARGNEEFPVNLDDVWPLAFARKAAAVEKLRDSNLFIEGIDYKVLRTQIEQSIEVGNHEENGLFPQTGEKSGLFTQNREKSGFITQNGEKVKMGRPVNIYMLSVPCLEFFIARKVRPVFEVYRQVFHKVAESAEVAAAEQQPDLTQPISLADTMQPLSDYMHQVDERWVHLLGDTASFADGHKKVLEHRQNWLVAYKNLFYFTSQLVYCETVNEIEGPQFV